MDWITGLLAGTSPFWCQYLAHKYPHWTESNGISSVALYGFLILMLGMYAGTEFSHKDRMRSFKDHCTERAPDIYVCDFSSYQGREPVRDGTGQRHNE